MLHNKIVRSALAGALGGFIGWMLSEPIMLGERAASPATMWLTLAIFGALVGVALGSVLGVAEGLALRSVRIALRGAVIGIVIGLVGGALGSVVAQLVYVRLMQVFPLARGAAWSVFGFFLGLSEGIRRFSLKGTRNAAVGGFLGGLIGGILFDVVGIFIGYIGGGTFSRGVGLATLGACIGILIALVERALAEAMLFVVQGRQEGRTILLDKPRMIVGRVETNDIYLSDAGIEPRHAEIRAEGRGYAIAPLRGTVLVNQAAVTHHVLQYDDEIQLGNARLRYRARRSAVRVPERVPARADEPPPYIQPSPPRPPAKDQLTMCPRCAHTNRGEAKFCARCGQGLM